MAQLERARRAAERTQQEAERNARIAELQELRLQSTSVHIQNFRTAGPPAVDAPPVLGPAWALAEAEAFHLRGVGRFARSERAAARQRAAEAAPAYLAEEQARLTRLHAELLEQAGTWWQALIANDELTVCDAVNAAFADNPAAGCAVGLQFGVLSVVMRQQDPDTLPSQAPGLTSAGRPTLKTMTKGDRHQWWLTIMGSNLIATIKEALATAPGVIAVDLAVLTRLPDTQRLSVVAFGQWTRQAIESTTWREPQDALRFLDIGVDITCGVSTSPPKIREIDTSRTAGLHELVDRAVDDGLDTPPELDPPIANPYSIIPFEQWATDRPRPTPVPAPPQQLVAGQNVVLPDDAVADLALAFSFAGADADLTLLLLGPDHVVRNDDDFAFYNQPVAGQGAARLLGKTRNGDNSIERASVRLSAVPLDIHRVLVCINMDVDRGLTCAALRCGMRKYGSTAPSPRGRSRHRRTLRSAPWSWSSSTDTRPMERRCGSSGRLVKAGQKAWQHWPALTGSTSPDLSLTARARASTRRASKR